VLVLKLVASKSSENVAQLKYLRTTLHCIHKEIKSTLNSGYSCNHSFQNCFVGVSNLVSHKREELRLRVSENRVLRRIFWPKREEVAGGRRRLNNEELHNFNSSPVIISVMKSSCIGLVDMQNEWQWFINSYNILIGRTKRRWKFNIRMDFRETV
jgi:hypothetical protein